MSIKKSRLLLLALSLISNWAMADNENCNLRPSIMNLRDSGVFIDGGFNFDIFGMRSTNGRPENCIFGAKAVGKAFPQAFVEQGFDTVDVLNHSISLSHVNFLPAPFNGFPTEPVSAGLPKLSFYSMEFTGRQLLTLSISAQALSATEFTLIVEATGMGGWVLVRNLSYTGLLSNPNATISVQRTGYDLTVSVGNDQMYFAGNFIPDTARFGSLKEQSVTQGSMVLFDTSSSCTNSAGIALRNCMREP
jgi:hypothetical protein